MNNKQTPIARRSGIVVKKMNNEVLLYDTERHQAHCLNESAALVWEHCDGTKTIRDLSMLPKLPATVSKSQREQVVWIALSELEKAGLLEQSTAAQPNKGLSRRQLIKAAGVATLVAIPVVATLIAPTAAQASTCLASGQSCGVSAQCCSGLCSTGVCV